MTTTISPDLLAHVAAVRDGDADDNELLVLADRVQEAGDDDRAELIRLQVELDPVLCEWGEPKSKRASEMTERQRVLHQSLCRLQDRERELLARNPSWLSVECPECPGSCGRWLGQYLCTTCNGTGDLLNVPIRFGHVPATRATITRGFLDVTLPAEMCWETVTPQCRVCQGRGGWEDPNEGQFVSCRCDRNNPPGWRSGLVVRPVLRAILASPAGPWVRRVRVEGREPEASTDRPGQWFWVRGMERLAAGVPVPVFDLMEGIVRLGRPDTQVTLKYQLSEQAAADALSRAVVRWARGEG